MPTLTIDPAAETERICLAIREAVLKQLRRKGVVIGLSGGIDSTVVASLATRALGRDRVFGLFTPEPDSSEDSLRLGQMVSDWLAIKSHMEDIGPILLAAGCYSRRNEAVRRVVPEYTDAHKCKLVLPNLIGMDHYPIFSVVVRSPTGTLKTARLTLQAYLGIVAATNLKQRTRKMMEYYHADRLHYAVAGTPNLLEYDQGFFVKNGDGAADLKPIAHLYKTQVYQLARYLGVPSEVQQRPPTTDTYPLEQSQEEFYFSMPLEQLDLYIYGRNHGISPDRMSAAMGSPTESVSRAYAVIDSRRRAARYLHLPPIIFGAPGKPGEGRGATWDD
jgi:NAD+ synthase